MPPTELHDRLVDTLLWELLGGENPPDLLAPVLAKAFPRRRVLWWVASAAAAIVAAAGLLGWHFWSSGYSEPRVSGAYEIVGGAKPTRGATIITAAGPATVTLGGYCRVDLQPATALRIEGEALAEQVYLARGGVDCEVQPKAGAFAVRTDVGTVSAVGTAFSVLMLEGTGNGTPPARQMRVRVRTGTVRVSGTWGEQILDAGQERLLPDIKGPQPAGIPGRPPETPSPAGIWNFQGYLVGTISSVDDSGVVLRVSGIKPGAGDKSKDPGCIIGQDVRVVFNVYRDRDGRPIRDEGQFKAAAQLAGTGRTATLRVVEERGKVLIMHSLTPGDQTGMEKAK